MQIFIRSPGQGSRTDDNHVSPVHTDKILQKFEFLYRMQWQNEEFLSANKVEVRSKTH